MSAATFWPAKGQFAETTGAAGSVGCAAGGASELAGDCVGAGVAGVQAANTIARMTSTTIGVKDFLIISSPNSCAIAVDFIFTFQASLSLRFFRTPPSSFS
jgi:hypothetical protein